MTNHKCGACTRRMPTDATICTGCMDLLLLGLGDVPALAEDLDLTLRKRVALGGMITLNPSSENRTLDRPELGVQIQAHPYSTTMSDALAVIRATLTKTVKALTDQHPERAPDDITGMSRWLMLRSERVRHHPDAALISDAILHAVGVCWAAVDYAPDGSTFQVGPCPELVDGGPCEGEIRAFIPADLNVEAKMVCTRDVGHAYVPSQWRRAGERINHERARRVG